MEKIYVSEISYAKASDTFRSMESETGFEFIPVPEDEPGLAKAIRENHIKAFIADIHHYTGELYEALPNGGVIARFGVGHDSIDKVMASKHGIHVANTPGVLDNAVAEHAVWMIGALARHLHLAHQSTKAGEWKPKGGIEVRGRKVSILGCGRIGRSLARKLHFGLEMIVTGYVRNLKPNDPAVDGIDNLTTSLEDALADADFVVNLLPVVEDTKHLANASLFGKMRQGACFINSARGAIVCENDLFDALSTGQLSAAALDVFEVEPYEPQDAAKDLRTLPNILLTPHIGSNTAESNAAMARAAATNVFTILTQGSDACPNIVNR